MISRSGVWLLGAVIGVLLAASLPAAAQIAPAPAATPPTTAATAPAPAAVPQAIKLTLQQALDMTLQRHPDVVSAQAAAVAAQAAAVQVRALRLPQITAQADLSYSKGLLGSNGSSDSPTTSHNVDIGLDYTIFRSGLNDQIKRAEVQAAAQLLGIPDAQRLLAFDVRQNYFAILAFREVARALLQTMANAERHREQVQARVDAGTAPRSDLLPIEVEVAQARLASVQAETNLDTSYASLKALLQIPADQQVDLTDALPNQAFTSTLDDLLCVGETNRPDVAAQKLTIRAAQLATRVAQAQAGLQFNANATANEGNHDNTTSQQWQVKIGASYPLYDAGASKAGVTAARANAVSAEQGLVSLRLNMQRDIESAYLQVQQSAIAMEVAAVGTRSAESSLAAAEARYQEGLAIIIEVTDAQVQLLTAQVAEIRAHNDYATALAQLAFATATDLQNVTPAAPAATPATGENR